MKQLAPQRVDWNVYRGRDVFTADNCRLGVVSDVFRDTLTGVLFIRIRNEAVYHRTLDLPVSAVGLISKHRLMLDVAANQLTLPGATQADTSRARLTNIA